MATDYSKFGGSFLSAASDKASGSSSSSGSSSTTASKKKKFTDYSAFASNYADMQKKRQQEIEDAKSNADAQLAQDNSASAPGTANGAGAFFKGVGDVAGAIGKGLAENYDRIGKGTANLISDITGQTAASDKAYSDAQNTDQADLLKFIALNKQTPGKYDKVIKTISDNMNTRQADYQKSKSDIVEQNDPTKAAAAVGGIGLDIITGGTLRGAKVALDAAKGTKAAVDAAKAAQTVSTATKVVKVAKNVGKGAAIGGAYGADQAVVEHGKDVTPDQILKGAAVGAAVGGAVPIVGAGAKALHNAAPVQAVDKLFADTAKKVANKVGETKVATKIGNVIEKGQVALGESLAPVMRDFRGAVDKADGRQVNENVRLLDGNVTNSAAITQGRLRENGAWQDIAKLYEPKHDNIVERGAARKALKEDGKFVSAKQDAINYNKLNPKKPQKEIPVGTERQEQLYTNLNKATKQDIQYAYENGLIKKSNYDKYIKDNNYTHVARDLGDDPVSNFKGVGGPNGSISSNQLQKRLKGSGKKALDPTTAYFDWANKITKDVQRQKLSAYIIRQRQELGLGKGYLRKADNVEARQAAIGEANQTRVLRNGLAKAVKSESRYGKKLQAEMDLLQKKGKDLSIKNAGSTKGVKPRSGLKAHIDNLMKTSNADLTRIRNKIATRDPKLAKHIDNLISLKNSHEVAKKAVRDLLDVAHENADKIATNKATIKTFNKGIKEVWEDDPRIVDAINKVGKVELHALIKVFQAPSKLVQRTATALNFVFTTTNLVKDQASSFVLSKNALATHNPVSFLMGLNEAALKPTARALAGTVGAKRLANSKVLAASKEYEQFLKFVAGSTRTDINRGMLSTAKEAAKSLGLKTDNVIRKVENINSATENLTRFQNYIGTMRNDVKKGVPFEIAQKNAIQAARENSVDFSRSGDWAPFLKIFNPFLNASTQGSRSLVRAFAERPLSTSLKVAATLYAPVAASTYWNLSDPKRALIYSQISPATRDSNLIFITDSGDILKLPLQPGLRELAAPVRGTIEAQYGAGEPQTFLKTAKSLFVDSLNPSNGASDLVPTFARPIVENLTNYSFFNKDAIVPDYLQTKDPQDQVFSGTSQTYKDIGAKFGISPLLARNLIVGYGTSVAEQGVSLYDKLRQAGGAKTVNGNPISTDNRDTVNQLQSKFFNAKPDQQKAANNAFYKVYTPLNNQRTKVSAEVTTLVKAGKLNEAKRKAQEFNATLGGKFGQFNQNYLKNPDVTEDPSWKDMLNSLSIGTSDRAFTSRLK